MDARRLSTAHAALAAALIGLCAALAGRPARAEAPTPVEYLHAEANEGGSSGGHVALRLGRDVFHYQQQGGLLRLLRTDLADFLREYALSGNRSVHGLRLALSEETAARLLAGFETRQRAASRQQDRLAALRADRGLLLRALSGRTRGALRVPAAGFFAAAFPAPAPAAPDPTLARLRERVEARYGAGFLDARLAGVSALRARLAPGAPPTLGPIDAESEPPLYAGYAWRHADLAAAATALEVLRDAAPLRDGSLVPADPAAPRLSASERQALCGFRDALSEELVRLAASGRPDWGGSFLLGAARLLALEAGCVRAELLVLDAFAGATPPRVEAPRPEALALLLRDADAARDAARLRLLEGAWQVRRLSDLESAAGRAAELRRAAGTGVLRVPEGRPVPARAARRDDLPPAPVSRERLAALLATTRAREREARLAIRERHAYHLISHNCVTEIFRGMNAALGGAPREIASALGGYLDPAAPGLFVPFVSASAVRQHFRVSGEWSIPSLRAARVARLAAEEGPWLTALRELSPLSARSYAWAAADSPFLFFTDAVPALRPIFGAANLATGTGAALIGLLRAPWDGGARLGAGLRGMLWSLPEIAFVDVRKGTNEYVEPQWIAESLARARSGEIPAGYAASTTTAIEASVSGAPSRQ